MNRRELMQAGIASVGAIALPAIPIAPLSDQQPAKTTDNLEQACVHKWMLELKPGERLQFQWGHVNKVMWLSPETFQRYELTGEVFMGRIESPYPWRHKEWVVLNTANADKVHIPYPGEV